MLYLYFNKFKTLFARLRVKYRTAIFIFKGYIGFHQCEIEQGVIICQSVTVQGRGKIKVKKNSQLGVYPSPGFYTGEFYLEARHQNSEVYIGENVVINNNCLIIADKSRIEIGDNTMIGPNFVCFDSNFHGLHPSKRQGNNYQCKPVIIGKNVFIGEGVKVLKGVSVGDNSVLAAGLILNFDVPPNVIVCANGDLIKFKY